jgi:hypothetical protein
VLSDEIVHCCFLPPPASDGTPAVEALRVENLCSRFRSIEITAASPPAKAGDPVTRDAAAYWVPHFHPKSALADFGYYVREIGNIRLRRE